MTVKDDNSDARQAVDLAVEALYRTPSIGTTCIEVAMLSRDGQQVDEVRIRDSKNRLLPYISTSYQAFVKLEESRTPGTYSAGDSTLVVTRQADGDVRFVEEGSSVHLVFSPDEWLVFVDGCRASYFERENYGIAA